MNYDPRCVTLYTKNRNGGTVQSGFCFTASAVKAAREMGEREFVVAIHGRIQHVEGNIDPHRFMS